MSEKLTSLAGKAYYPHLNNPDYGNKEFPNPDGSFHVKLTYNLEDPGVAEFIDWVDEQHDEAVAAFKESLVGPDKKYKTEKALLAAVKKARNIADLNGRKPYDLVEDEEGEPTGEVRFNFKMKYKVTNKKTKKSFFLKPRIFDAKGKLMKNPPLIYGGSTLKVSYTPLSWGTVALGASVRLRMEAVQVINLITGGGSDDAEDYGFGEEEGYEASESALKEAPAEEATESDGADDADDDDGEEDF